MDNLKKFMDKNKKILRVCLAAVIAVGGFVVYNRRNNSQRVTNNEKIYTVRTVKIGATGNDVYLSYAGLIQPAEIEQATIAVVGKVTEIYVKEGDNVVKGQALFRVDSSNYERERDIAYQNMKASESARNSAQSTMDRANTEYNSELKKPTYDEKIKADSDLVEATADAQRAKKEVEDIETRLSSYSRRVDEAEKDYRDKERYYKENPEDDGAKNDFEQARERLEKAKNDLKSKEDELGYARAKANYEQAVSKQEAAQAKVDEYNRLGTTTESRRALAKSRYDSARAAYESADYAYQSSKVSYENAVKHVEDCVYKAGMDGYIIMKVSDEGGIATPLNPVVVIGSHKMIAQFGVSQVDIKDVSVGMEATVTVEGEVFYGKVTGVSVMPDQSSRTYATDVEINAPSKSLYLGELATVQIRIGERTGIWLPISVVMNDGQDYVFAVEESRVVRKNVIIQDISNDYVRVTGLEGVDEIIIEGMKTVKSGNLVNVIGEE